MTGTRKSADAGLAKRLQSLPSVEELASSLPPELSRRVAVAAAREEIEAARARLVAGEPAAGDLRELAARRAAALGRATLRRVINATGVVLHTNLGRAPLAPRAAAAAAEVGAGYSNLEYDLGRGERGSRHDHLDSLLRGLTGAPAAIAVNNNAAAVMLALMALAAGREVVISRGQLVEIGGSFRIPEILAHSGARLVEVGTTNRTRLADYEEAIGPETAAIMRVHQSNFRTVGFTEEVALRDLCALARERGLTVIDDLGSGALAPIADETPVRRSVEDGADIVCCSADKLLGGPQAGLLVGSEAAVALCRSHPVARALRLDKLQLAALEATLRLHRDEGPAAIPALAMLAAPEAELRARAERLAARIGPAATIEASSGKPGGGSLPLLELPGPVCAVDPGQVGADELAARLREAEPPVIARIAAGRLVLDPRTMSDDEAEAAAAAVARVLD